MAKILVVKDIDTMEEIYRIPSEEPSEDFIKGMVALAGLLLEFGVDVQISVEDAFEMKIY